MSLIGMKNSVHERGERAGIHCLGKIMQVGTWTLCQCIVWLMVLVKTRSAPYKNGESK